MKEQSFRKPVGPWPPTGKRSGNRGGKTKNAIKAGRKELAPSGGFGNPRIEEKKENRRVNQGRRAAGETKGLESRNLRKTNTMDEKAYRAGGG